LNEPGRIEDGWDVCDVNGDKIGEIAAILPDYFTMDTGFLGLGKNYRVPLSAIKEIRDNKVFLNTTKDRIDKMDWSEEHSYPGAQPWDTVSEQYQARWQHRFGGQPGARWQEHEPYYRYGYEMHNRPEYRGKRWNEVEPHFRRDWEGKYRDKPWDRASSSIRNAWEDFAEGGEERRSTGMRTSSDRDTSFTGSRGSTSGTTFVPGSGGGDYPSSSSRETGPTGFTGGQFGGGNWNDVSSRYHSRWQTRHATKPTGSWEEYEPYYRYGYEMYNRPEYRGKRWNEVEPEFRRDWSQRYSDKPWDRAANAIREAWEDFTGGEGERGTYHEDEAIGGTRSTGEGRYGTSTGMTEEERRRRERGPF
jgi:hypothetical protein